MRYKEVRLLSIYLGLTAGNFLFQLLSEAPNWEEAATRSLFQGVAVLAVAYFPNKEK